MSLEQEHNASNEPFIPEGLEYREEYWYNALEKIEAHERFVRWKKFAWYAAAAMVVGLALGIGYATLRSGAQNQMAQNTELPGSTTATSRGDAGQEQQVAPSISTESIKEITDSMQGAVASATNDQASGSMQSFGKPAPAPRIQKVIKSSDTADEVAEAPSKVATNDFSQQNGMAYAQPNNTKLPKKARDKAADMKMASSSGTKEVEESPTADNRANASSTASGVLTEGRGPVNAPKSAPTEIATSALEIPALAFSKMTALPGTFEREEPTLSLLSVRVPRAEAWPISDYNLQAAAGVSVWRDFSTHAGDVATDPFIRLSAERNFNRRWSMESGVEWTSISGPTAKFEQVYTTYDFNYINNITSVATNKLHYLTVPLLAKWRLKERMQLQAGTGVSVLFAGTNTITERQETAVSAQVTRTYSDNGYIAGFRRMNAFAQVGMQYWIGKQTAIGVNFQYGLTDITNNTYFGKAYIDRNSRLTIELKRNIL